MRPNSHRLIGPSHLPSFTPPKMIPYLVAMSLRSRPLSAGFLSRDSLANVGRTSIGTVPAGNPAKHHR